MRKIIWVRAAVLGAAAIMIAITIAGRREFAQLAPDASSEQIAEQLGEVLDRAMDRYTISGVAAGAISGGQVIWSAREGVRSADGAPVTGQTAFNLGSISKPITVWTVLSLVDRGLVDLDRPVGDYLTRYEIPASEFDASGVTVRRLLQHTAGTNVQGYGGYGSHEEQPADSLDLTENFSRVGIIEEPGSVRRYSGGGYVLLQMMVEDVTGRSFDAVARESIFDPLGMSDSAFEPARLDEVSAAFAYYGNTIEALRDVALSAAGGYASADDLERFLLAHMAEQNALPNALRETALAPTAPNPNFAMSYTRWESPTGWLYGHGGNNSTWHGQIYVRPETGDGFYFLTNTTGGAQLDLDLSCAWLSMMESDIGDATCRETLGLSRSIGWWACGFGLAAVALLYWLVAEIIKERRIVSLIPHGRGSWRLTGRMFAAALMGLLFAASIWIFYTNSVIWRTETVLIDEVPLDEIEGLAVAIIAAFGMATLALWSSPEKPKAT